MRRKGSTRVHVYGFVLELWGLKFGAVEVLSGGVRTTNPKP